MSTSKTPPKLVQELAEAQKADVVLASWPDALKENGLDTMIVKGVELLERIAASDSAQVATMKFTRVADADEALALERVLREQAP